MDHRQDKDCRTLAPERPGLEEMIAEAEVLGRNWPMPSSGPLGCWSL